MTSAVEICNRALIRLGADLITSLTQDTVESRCCLAVYDAIRRDLLRSHPWNFAVKRVSLAQSVDLPDFGFYYKYALPSDYLMLISLDEDNNDFKIEGGFLLTDSDTVDLVYIADVTDEAIFDSMFATMFALRIALEIGYKITGSTSIVETLKQEYRLVRAESRTKDGQEGTVDQFIDFDWLDSRF